MAKTDDHEIVSIYPFTDEEEAQLMTHSYECVLMWTTKDGWPVGVTHAFVWHEGKIWVTFTRQRHRAAAIRRDNRVSVNISSGGYPSSAPSGLPWGAITYKGHGTFHDDDDTRHWMYRALSSKLNPDNPEGEAGFYQLLDSPLRTVLSITPIKRIMYNAGLAERHIAGQVEESELGERLESDTTRMQRERDKQGLPER